MLGTKIHCTNRQFRYIVEQRDLVLSKIRDEIHWYIKSITQTVLEQPITRHCDTQVRMGQSKFRSFVMRKIILFNAISHSSRKSYFHPCLRVLANLMYTSGVYPVLYPVLYPVRRCAT
jgi:hypothetical protein